MGIEHEGALADLAIWNLIQSAPSGQWPVVRGPLSVGGGGAGGCTRRSAASSSHGPGVNP